MTYLIKSPYAGHHIERFHVTDEEAIYKRNSKNLGPEWIFVNSDIKYEFNSYGYRMNKELHEVNFDNYYAFFGCSNTVGIGLELKDTFAYTISEQSKVDYINGAIPGSSPEFVCYNIVTLLEKAPKLPKAIVVYWPEPTRTCYWEKGVLNFCLANCFPVSDYWHEAYKSYLMEDSHILNKFKMNLTIVRQLCKANNIKLFDFTAKYISEMLSKTQTMDLPLLDIESSPNLNECKSHIEWINLKYARDVILDETKLPNIVVKTGHPGLYHQSKIVEAFFKFMTP
jgi:hypothetical protein